MLSSAELKNLDLLQSSGLRVVGRGLVIDTNPSLENVRGLYGLERIEGSLTIATNPLLEGLEGLEKLELVGGDPSVHTLTIVQNASLASLTALGSEAKRPIDLRTSLMVNFCPALVSLEGVRGLETTTSATIIYNDGLLGIGALADLRATNQLIVASNAALTRIDFPQLEVVDFVNVSDNSQLESVSFPRLTTVTELLGIFSNPMLVSLGALDQLTSVEAMNINTNAMLPQCLVNALDARLMACGSCGDNNWTEPCD